MRSETKILPRGCLACWVPALPARTRTPPNTSARASAMDPAAPSRWCRPDPMLWCFARARGSSVGMGAQGRSVGSGVELMDVSLLDVDAKFGAKRCQWVVYLEKIGL